MPDAPATAPVAPVPVKQEPTKIPPPVAAGSQGAGALAEGDKGTTPENPFEFDLDVKGQKQKMTFAGKEQLKAVLQKALYADQVIKDATQAKKGAETLMQKLKTPQGLREVLSDPAINLDVKNFALEIVREMMDDEKLTPEQKEARDAIKERDSLRAEKKEREEAAERLKADEARKAKAIIMRGEITNAMKKYPDIPQTQATMDAVILNMRAAYQRFGRALTPDQAMSVMAEQYWNSWARTVEKMPDDQIAKRIPSKLLDKIQQFKLNQLKEKTDPSKQQKVGDAEVKKKKHLTEKEFERHFQSQTLAGL